MNNKKLAHYEVIEQIGAGGMGEVYLARDTKLERSVAIKVIPEFLAQDPERLARFRREAKLLASLNHAHIATLHGLEESNGQQFLVMELIEGDDLSERIRRGPIPVNEALQIAGHVAEALKAAHDQDIVHRDLKPANIKLTSDDKVKVLDFGLAKALETDASDPRISQSPTLQASMGTVGGMILGTAAYMSPEQARGKPIDKRTDIWALGCVLYEMLTGQAAFPGETVSDTIAKILEREPDWSALPANTPPTIQIILRRCLQKDQKKRLQDVGDVRIQIEEVLSGTADSWTTGAIPADLAAPSRAKTLPWMIATVVLGVAAIALAVGLFMGGGAQMQTIRSVIEPGKDMNVISTGDFAGPVTISPDGTQVVYVAAEGRSPQMLWLRDLRTIAPRAITGSEGATFPFWSSDGRSLGFFAGGKLKRVDLAGGLPISLCDAINGRGGAWGADGTILFSPDFRAPLFTVRASGGTPVRFSELDRAKHTTHRWPHFMPDGKHFIYIAANHDVSRGAEHNTLVFGALDDKEHTDLMRANMSAVFASGHLLFLRDNTLMAAPFDPSSGEFKGDPIPMPDKVAHDPTTWFSAISASKTGMLMYHGGVGATSAMRLAVYSRDGEEIDVIEEGDGYYSFDLSPDDSRLAISAGMMAYDIWTIELTRKIRSRLSFQPLPDIAPIWSADQKYVAYSRLFDSTTDTLRTGTIYRVLAEGGEEDALYTFENDAWVTDWSPDGRHLLVSTGLRNGDSSNVWVLPLAEDGSVLDPYPLLATQFAEDNAKFSPDGKWITYNSNESNVAHVYVTPFLGAKSDLRPFRKWQVSTEGGFNPRWISDNEIIFVGSDFSLDAAEVEPRGDKFFVGGVTKLFTANLWNLGRVNYDVTTDGQRFVLVTISAATESPMTLVTNWLADVKK